MIDKNRYSYPWFKDSINTFTYKEINHDIPYTMKVEGKEYSGKNILAKGWDIYNKILGMTSFLPEELDFDIKSDEFNFEKRIEDIEINFNGEYTYQLKNSWKERNMENLILNCEYCYINF